MLRNGLSSLATKRYLNTNAKPTQLQAYVESMSSNGATFPKSFLRSLQAETRQLFRDAHKMIPLHQAEFLYSFTRMIRPENVLEIGTFTGMSTISIAAGTHGMITTIERDSVALGVAKSWLERAGMANRITFEEGIALDMSVTHLLSTSYLNRFAHLQCLYVFNPV
jgi:caffeoyl-CoA O-methyltransferase